MEGNEAVFVESVGRQQTAGAQFSNKDISVLPIQGGPGCLHVCRSGWENWAAEPDLSG